MWNHQQASGEYTPGDRICREIQRSKFENGTAGNLSLSTFLLLLKVVGQIDAINDVLPELPPSPYLMKKDEKKAQRIRHTK